MNNKLFAAFVALYGMGMMASSEKAAASGFALVEQSASGLGSAYSGGAASAEDATTVFFNPAGMLMLKGQQISAPLHYISPAASFNKDIASNAAGAAFSGGDSGDAGVSKFVPNIFYTNRISDTFAMGIGVSTPFGLATEYDKTWVGRYHAVNSDVKTINFNPSIAIKLSDKLFCGAGFNAQYMKAELGSMIDFGLAAYKNQIAAGNVAGATALATAGVLSNPNADIYGNMKGDSWGFGNNFGILYIPTESTRVGVAYRSKIRHSLEGDATFTQQNTAYLTGLGLAGSASAMFKDQSISADITLPATVSFSIYHKATPKIALMADATWTEWSSFDKLLINFDGTLKTQPSQTTENWENTWRIATGLSYSQSPKLTLRTGVAYDQVPVPDAEHRTPRIPDNDRFWIALGTGYLFNDNFSFDFGYAHLFVKDAPINKSTVGEDAGRGKLVGSYDDSVDIASVQLNLKF